MGIKAEEFEKQLAYEDIEVLNPELGRLESRVQKFYLNELFNDTGPDLEETAYWFHTPPGGWNRERVQLEPADELPVEFPQPLHEEADAEGRMPLENVSEGMVVTGTVTDVWWFHGAQVDFGSACDGLIPIYQEQWMQEDVREALMPGAKVEARVYKKLRAGLYRWPLQLELLQPTPVAAKLPPPEEYSAPVDHAWAHENGMGMEEVMEATGRTYEPATYYLRPDQTNWTDEMQQAMGHDVEELDVPDEHPLEEKLFNSHRQRLNQVATEQLLGRQE